MSISEKNHQYYTIYSILYTIYCIPTFGPPCMNARERQNRAQNIKFCILEHFPLKIAKHKAPYIFMFSVFPLASSFETVHWFSWYKKLIHFKVTPTPCSNFYFPPISYNKMADTRIFKVVATILLLTFRPQNDSLRLRILYVCYCNSCCSKKFLFSGRK